jgi:replicative DNA helicase
MDLHDKSAEESLIGSVMISGAIFAAVRDVARPADFSVPEYAELWRVIGTLADGDPDGINIVTVAAAARHAEIRITPADISRLTDAVAGSIKHTPHVAELIHDLADRRRIVEACARTVAGLSVSSSSHSAARELVDALDVLATDTSQDAFIGMDAATDETIERLASPSATTSTGIRRLDDLGVQFHRGDYVILGGQTSHGKTAMACSFMIAAAQAGTPCFLFSLEMPVSAVMQRLWACLGAVPLSTIRQGSRGTLSASQRADLASAQDKARALPIRINDKAGISLDDVRACAAGAPAGALVVVDYIGLMTASSDARAYGSKVHEVSAMSLGLQRIARDCDVTLLALSQLSRKSDGRTDKAPQLSDLRDSGSLEQDASLVMLVSLPHRYDAAEPETRAVLTVAKHRQGECGSVEMHYDGAHTRFTQATLSTMELPDAATVSAMASRNLDRTRPKQYDYAGARK